MVWKAWYNEIQCFNRYIMIYARTENQGHLGSVVYGTASGRLAGHWSSLVDVASRRVPRLLRYLVQDRRIFV